MATIDWESHHKRERAKKIIAELPLDQKADLQFYIEELEGWMKDLEERNKAYQAVFDGIARFTYVNRNPVFK